MKTKTRRSSGTLLLLAAVALSVPASAQTIYPYNLTPNVSGDEDVLSFRISPDGSRVVYLSDQRTDEVFELFSVALAEGGAALTLNSSLPSGGDVMSFQLSMETGLVVYLADQDTSGVEELYSVAIGGGTPVKLNDPLVIVGDVTDFRISANGRWVVYRADQDADGVFELYSVSSSGIGTREKLNGSLATGGDVWEFEISPDSRRVVYRADQGADEVLEVFSVPIGGGGAVKLNGPLVAAGDVEHDFTLSADSSRVVYRADQDTDDVIELYSVPLVGGAAVKLNNPLVTGGDIRNFRMSPDSSRVLYAADQVTDERFELYSAPIAGGFAAVKVNGILAPGGNVGVFQLSPDSRRVVYRADQDTNEVNELYSVSIGGGPTVKLNGLLVGSADVQGDFTLSADSSRVVYRADQVTNDMLELYSVPLGGGAAVKLNGPLVAGGDVGFFSLSADSSRVVYRANQDTSGFVGLYSVPIAGGNAAKLNGPGDAGAYAVSPDSSLVVYRADQETDTVFALFVGKAQAIWESSGGNWFSAGNWKAGVPPDPTLEAVITVPASVRVTSPNSPAGAESLVLGGVRGSSVLELADGTALILPMGAEILPGGVLRGDGIFSVGNLPLQLPPGAEVRAAEGERFVLQSGQVTNGGTIEAFGTPFLPAEVEFVGELTNTLATGAIVGHDCTLRFPQDLVNEGSLRFGNGLNDVQGVVNNESRASITVSGGATAIFYGDVSNDGNFNVSASGGLVSTAVFFGTFSGNGISGSGHVFLEGGTRPGLSPGTMTFGGEVSFGPFARLEIELGGTEAGTDHDQVTVAGHLELGGSLSVSLLDGFVPAAGMVFDLWEAGSVAGAFASVTLPALPPGLFWHDSEVNTSGELKVGCVPDSYPAFAVWHGLLGAPGDDEEPDHLSNLIEYVLALDPTVADPVSAHPILMPAGNNDLFQFTMADPLGPDVIIAIETSTDLAHWSPLGVRLPAGTWSGPVALSRSAPGKVQVTLTTPTTPPRRFYRLAVTLVP